MNNIIAFVIFLFIDISVISGILYFTGDGHIRDIVMINYGILLLVMFFWKVK